jgi:hypothetical protein
LISKSNSAQSAQAHEKTAYCQHQLAIRRFRLKQSHSQKELLHQEFPKFWIGLPKNRRMLFFYNILGES